MDHLRHISLIEPPEQIPFTSTTSFGNRHRIPNPDRHSHAVWLRQRLTSAWEDADAEQAVYALTRQGIYLEFRGAPGHELITKSLESLRGEGERWVRLLNVREESTEAYDETTGETTTLDTVFATVFVPHVKRDLFFNRIEKYATELDARSGKPKNYTLINSIADIRKALAVESFWVDEAGLVPDAEPEWCEVWLSTDSREELVEFERLLEAEQIPSKPGAVYFPERSVKVVLANRAQLASLSALSDRIAEMRKAKATAAFWTGLQNREQAEWVESLLEMLEADEQSNISVCILDTGANNNHPLLAPLLSTEECLSVRGEWGTEDHDKHGTLMAGVVAYGDLVARLSEDERFLLRHRMESVKILPPPPAQNQPDLWGHITAQGISLAEIEHPGRTRVVCMAVASDDTRDQGRPSSWSGAIDAITSGADDDFQRLLIVCTGNTADITAPYPDALVADSIHDPGQAWNALTVGAFTRLDTITDETFAEYEPVAEQGQLSPFSTTSRIWDDDWPIKPELVMEGGNVGRDANGFVTECDDLSLLSTYYKPHQGHFYPFNATSSAAALAANMAAQIQAEYPDFWPETVRALMVHSADWPEALRRQFLANESSRAYRDLLRTCGYGVPSLTKALYSASNSLTLISEATLQPFDQKLNSAGKKEGYKTKDMHLYELPWPKEVLLELPDDVEVEMRVTLSYFVEPGPGEIGWQDRYRYQSHALRFDIISPEEERDDFVARINAEGRGEGEAGPDTPSAAHHWRIGPQARNKGSIHSDVWTGTAAQLADSNVIAVFPRIGWWRERHYLNKWNRQTRYALVVSITASEEDIDVYTPVAVQVGIEIPTTTT